MTEIFTVALYRYATTGEAPSGYDAGAMGAALGGGEVRINATNGVRGACFHSRQPLCTA